MKTFKGIQTYGFFELGADTQFANSLYSTLEGDDRISEDSVITIDLIRRESGLPIPLGLKHCSYHQLAENIKLITKALFKHLNLEA